MSAPGWTGMRPRAGNVMPPRVRTGVLLVLCLTPVLAAADFYQCRQADGSRAFQDRPCAGSARPVQAKVDTPAPPSAKPAAAPEIAVSANTTPPTIALGLPPANQYVRHAVVGVEVRPMGVLLVRFNGQSGVDGGEVRFKADVSKPHMGLGWDCTTPHYRDIAQWAGSCRYTGN